MTPDSIKKLYPQTKGVFATVTWKSLELTKDHYDNWHALDSALKGFTDKGFYVLLMLWTGQNVPKWIYDAPSNVPPVYTTRGVNGSIKDTFPFYFFSAPNGDTVYKTRWYIMIDTLRGHIQTLSNKDSIGIYQSAEGSTGDEAPYKGTLED